VSHGDFEGCLDACESSLCASFAAWCNRCEKIRHVPHRLLDSSVAQAVLAVFAFPQTFIHAFTYPLSPTRRCASCASATPSATALRESCGTETARVYRSGCPCEALLSESNPFCKFCLDNQGWRACATELLTLSTNSSWHPNPPPRWARRQRQSVPTPLDVRGQRDVFQEQAALRHPPRRPRYRTCDRGRRIAAVQAVLTEGECRAWMRADPAEGRVDGRPARSARAASIALVIDRKVSSIPLPLRADVKQCNAPTAPHTPRSRQHALRRSVGRSRFKRGKQCPNMDGLSTRPYGFCARSGYANATCC
jgi:hypothetical protein